MVGDVAVAGVAANILVATQRFAAAVHRQVYAHPMGHSPQDVLAALGDKADGVKAVLAAAELLAAPTVPVDPVVESPPEPTA